LNPYSFLVILELLSDIIRVLSERSAEMLICSLAATFGTIEMRPNPGNHSGDVAQILAIIHVAAQRPLRWLGRGQAPYSLGPA
jgi:hypothetical protein